MEKVVAEIKADEDLEVEKIVAEAGLETGKIKAEQARIVLETEAKGAAEVANVVAEANKFVSELQSRTDLELAKNRAEAINAEGAAEKEAASKLRSRREYELDKKRVNVWSGMASNKDLVISGESGDNAMAQLYAAAQTAQVFGLPSLVGGKHK